MKKKQWIACCLAFVLVFLFSGCSASNDAAGGADGGDFLNEDITTETASNTVTPETDKGWDSGAGQDAASGQDMDYGGHKIIKTASLGLETRTFDEMLASIKERVSEMGGYVERSDISGKEPENYGDGGRNAFLTLRIPQEKMESFLEAAKGMATVTYESTGTEDITASYFDTESRLEIYQTQRERVLALLEEADTMEDILTLETELARLNYEIDALTTQLRQWDDLVDFATVEVSLTEIPLVTAVSGEESIWTRMQDGLVNTLGGMGVFFEGLLVFLVSASPVLLIIAIIVIVIVLLAKRSARRRREKQKNMPPQYPVPPDPGYPSVPSGTIPAQQAPGLEDKTEDAQSSREK